MNKCSIRWILLFETLLLKKISSPKLLDLYRVHHFLISCNAWLPLRLCIVLRSACQLMNVRNYSIVKFSTTATFLL